AGDCATPFATLSLHPAATPEIYTTLRRDELILAVELPPEDFAAHHAYVKVRERASYAFALVSVAAVLRFEDGSIAEARIALGGVAHKPVRHGPVDALLPRLPATRD